MKPIVTITTLLILATALSACVGFNTHPAELSATVLEYGIYSTRVDGTEQSPGSASGRSNIVGDIRHMETTTDIPLQMGQSWGFHYQLEGFNRASALTLEQVITHPPIHGKTESRKKIYKKCGTKYYTGWTIEYPEEMVEGDFTWQIIRNGTVLIEKTFTVKKAI